MLDMSLDFSFGGVSAKSKGIILQSAIVFDPAEPYVEAVHIPGRNGDLHIYDGSFKNRKGTAKCYAYDFNNIADVMTDINSFLFSGFSGDYKQLITSDDPLHYWEARVVKAGEIQPRIGRINPFTIEFDCKPYRVSVNGGELVL